MSFIKFHNRLFTPLYTTLKDFQCSNAIHLDLLGFSQLNLSELYERFTEDEVWNVVRALPPDKAPGWLYSVVPVERMANHLAGRDASV
jgi:hypothetical protein